MTIKSRIQRLEALPVRQSFLINSMAEISTEQAEKTYRELMAGPHPHLFVKTNTGKVSINELPEQELGRIYKEYANGNLDTITDQEA